MLKRLWDRFDLYLDYLATVRQLHDADDDTLEDIGIARCDIPAHARRVTYGSVAARPALSRETTGPATTIGSDVWCRAFLANLR